MGTFVYGDETRLALSDRVLRHLEHVITTKLRRGEKFLFSWAEDASTGHGRTTVWMSSGCSLTFKYADGRHVPLNREWLTDLMRIADSPAGLFPTPEPNSIPDAAKA